MLVVFERHIDDGAMRETMRSDGDSSYAFGDTDVAARRLRLVAKVFEPEMRSFLSCVQVRPRLAVDLGCGPGHTTRLVAEVLRPERTVGLDTSGRFVEMAHAEPSDGLEYFEHDVATTPFPVGPADMMFCHLLLPHLRDPAAALCTWATQLGPAGLLLVDEVANIRTTQPIFQRYVDMVETVMVERGGHLYAGDIVAQLDSIPGLEMAFSRQVELSVSTAHAATMFRMDVVVWGRMPTMRNLFPRSSVLEIESDLEELTNSTSKCEIVWDMRQLMYEASPRGWSREGD